MWWPETSWFEDERVTCMEECEVEWILTEDNELPGPSHVLWKKGKGRVIYPSRQKNPQPPRVWKYKVVKVLHLKAGGET